MRSVGTPFANLNRQLEGDLMRLRPRADVFVPAYRQSSSCSVCIGADISTRSERISG